MFFYDSPNQVLTKLTRESNIQVSEIDVGVSGGCGPEW